MTEPPIRVLDTGTSPPDEIPEGVEVRHQPALVRRALPIDRDDLEALLDDPHHVVFYSRFAAQIIVDLDLPLQSHRLWAVGKKTAKQLKSQLASAVDVPTDENFEGLRAALSACGDPRPIVAFSLQDQTRDLSPVARNWSVDFTDFPVYESAPADRRDLAGAFDAHRPHWVTLTSSRGAHSVVDAIDTDRLRHTRIAAIGPSTAHTATELGILPNLVPDTPDRTGLLQAIANFDIS